jgi:integrase
MIARFLKAAADIPPQLPLVRGCQAGGAWLPGLLSNGAWNTALKKGLANAGVPADQLRSISSHSLRKAGFTAMIRAGVPVDVVQQVIGHKSPASARPYLRSTRADMLAAATRI